jgi:hypothetical protein
MQHVGLFVVVGSEYDIDDDVFNDLHHQHRWSGDGMDTHVDLSSFVRLDLLGIPYLLVGRTGLEVCIVLQSQLDQEIVVAQLDILAVSCHPVRTREAYRAILLLQENPVDFPRSNSNSDPVSSQALQTHLLKDAVCQLFPMTEGTLAHNSVFSLLSILLYVSTWISDIKSAAVSR